MREMRLELKQRLKAIELIAFWEGRLITTRLCQWFGISRQQASADINLYLNQINNKSLKYDHQIKGYTPTESFKPKLSSGYVNDYLQTMIIHGNDSMAQTLEFPNNFSIVQLPDRSIKPEIVREIMLACRDISALSITYASMHSDKIELRTITPHTLIYTGTRWHVRAYCHKNSEFRDFVLSRIIETPVKTETKTIGAAQDHNWNETVVVRLIPNRKLGEIQKQIIEQDYAMKDRCLTITCRKALLTYTLQRYPVCLESDTNRNPLKYPLMIHSDDLEIIREYSFG